MKLARIVVILICSIWLVHTSYASPNPVSAEAQARPNLPANFQDLPNPQTASYMPSEVSSNSELSVQMEFTNPPYSLQTVTIGGVPYSHVLISGEGNSLDPGVPDVPRVTRLIMIANTGQVGLTITDQSYTTLPLDHAPAPVQPLVGDDAAWTDGMVTPNAAIYSNSEWYPPQVAEMVGPATLRDVRFVVLTVYPVQVNPVTHEMRVYDRIDVSVDNLGGVGENELTITPTAVTSSFRKLYSEFSNFPGSPLDALPVVPGKQLMICADNQTVINEVQKLVDWRRRKGIDASYATTTQTGSTAAAIRTYISNQYTQSNGLLEFVTMVGDPDANAPYSLPSDGSQLDNYFGTMGGGTPDPVPDIAVGRLPVTSGSELSALIAKTIQYESDPYLADTTWFTRTWCAAHTNFIPSNPSMKEYTRQIMLQHGISTVNFDIFPGGIVPTTLNTRINQGVSVFNHRMSWIGEMSSGDLSGVANGRKLPFVMSVTCATGGFNGGSALSEDWVRRGTVATPAGAIGCVGMSGTGTHVPYNNIVDAGTMFGMYVEGIHEQGTALVAGKLQLYKNYAAYGHLGDVQNFSYWANLQGDPAVPIWSAVPRTPTVTRPSTVNRNTNNVAVNVARSGQPVEGALVGLVMGATTFSRGYTDAAGNINLSTSLPDTGYLYVTVTRENLDSYLDSIHVIDAAASLCLFATAVDDDNTGGTVGDGNGVLNPGETIDLNLQLRNSGTSASATGISGTLSTPFPGVQIVFGTQSYPNIAAGGNAAPNAPFRIHADAVFNNEPVSFFLTTTSSAGTQLIRVDLTPVAGDVSFVSSSFPDVNSRLDPGDTGNLTVTFTNSGGRSLSSASGVLRSLDSHVIVNDSVGTYGTVNSGANATNSGNPFNVTASTLTVGGYPAQMQLVITDANGFRDSTNFAQVVGVASTTTPTGPDAHGYYAYDNTETQPGGTASTYFWTEIAPGLGGPGASLGFTDGSEDGDQVAVRTLPFNFTFYGQTFNQVTICTNGWLAFGSQTIDDFRNYHIGSPIGPGNQIAAYWDDLIVTGIANGGVYTWSDGSTGRYVVEWRTRTLWPTQMDEVFQIILFSPAAYPSPTGDGKILIQYQTISPVANQGSNDNDWATVGIQNADHSQGLEYCYFNVYSPGATTLANGRAVMYTTDISGLVPGGLTLMAPNGGELWYLHTSAIVTWFGGNGTDNVRVELSRSGAGGPWETITDSTPDDGSYSLVVTGPASNACRIRITNVNDPGETDLSTADFTISPLNVISPNGGETWYLHTSVTTTWIGGGPSDNMRVEMSRVGAGGPWETVAASTPNDGTHAFTVSGPASNACRVRITNLSDAADTGTSAADFAIVPINITSPNGGEVWLRDSAGVVTWAGGDPNSNVEIELSRNGLNGPWITLSASSPNIGSFSWTVTGQTSLTCRVRVTSLGDPLDTGTSDADFTIQAIQTFYSENFENGAAGWTHSGAGGQWVDDWNLSTERSQSSTHSYKCGDTGTGTYNSFNDARLVSPVISELPADATLEFSYQIETEISGQYPDSAYDGGIVEVSANGGAFTQLTPVSGYPKTFRWQSGSGNPATGPMLGQPCYAGTVISWTRESFDLAAYSGQDIQLRFRFGSDQNTELEGWYLDDILIFAPAAVIEPVTPTNVTLYYFVGSLNLRWAADSNTFYRIYSSDDPTNPLQTLEGSTQGHQFTIPAPLGFKRFYVVVGWDGN